MIRIGSLIAQLYGEKEGKRIEKELRAYLETLPKEKYREDLLWYKSANMYVVYPDVIGGKHKKPLDNLIDFLPHIRDAGFHAVHVLPFLTSPMKDRGFDIKDYYTVRRSLGSLKDVQRLKHEARKQNLRIFMDLVFNHVSIEHEWFVKATNGEKKYRDYFIHTNKRPEFLRKLHKNSAVWAEYLVNRQKIQVNIAFPELAGEIPHWRHGKDGYWYYHTYRPDQIDLDWQNPAVFLECAKVLIFWAVKGFHFRLDAIQFVGKSAYKQSNTNKNFTDHILAALNHLAKQVNPECVFILETYEKIDTVIGYLGGKNIQQAELLYGFHLCTSLWVSLVEKKLDRVWQTLENVKKIPTFGEWMNFLRNHDELSFAYLDNTTLHEVRKSLVRHGREFRERYGVAGRTFSLLGEDKKRFLMAYMLLFSMPGGVMMPYGDEYAKNNSPAAHISKEDWRDARNINRGHLSGHFIEDNKRNQIYLALSHMLAVREGVRLYFNVWPEKQESAESVFHAFYNLGNSYLRTIINTSDERRTVTFPLKGYTKILFTNDVSQEGDNTIVLGPYAGVWLQR